MPFHIKRIYGPAQPADGVRILIDRLWPRGIKKTDARLDHWMKEIAPSPVLRLRFNHKPERFVEFSRHYREELAANPAVAELRKLGRGKTVTLLYGARDPAINHAVVLLSVLQKKPAPLKSKSAKSKSPKSKPANPAATKSAPAKKRGK